MTVAEFRASAVAGGEPPAGLSAEVGALWLCQAGRWGAAHDIVQEIDTPLGAWIHALVHLIEGDEGNARYWFARAGQPAVGRGGIEAEWERIATAALSGDGRR
jgi:hypothetical protein